MRALLLLLLVPALALANPKEVETVLVTHLMAFDKGVAHDQLGYAKDATIVVFGQEWSAKDNITVLDGIKHLSEGAIKHKPGKPTIGLSDDFAWFQMPYDVVVGGTPGYRAKERFGGLVVRTKTGWELAGAVYSDLVADGALFSDPNYIRDPITETPTLHGDPKIGAVVAGWFKTGFAGAVAKRPNVVASGTSPREYQTGAGATKLAKAWDKLRLAPDQISVKTYANGKAAVATMSVAMPRKKTAISMDLVIVLVLEGTEWKWVSMQFSV